MKKQGFTLVELLVVIVVIAILASGLFMMTRAGGDKAGIAQTTTRVHAVAGLLEVYKAQYGAYPRVLTGVDSNTGVASITFSFVCDPGDDDSVMDENTSTGGLSDSNKITFGLFSHFVPRATLIRNEASEAMKSYYEGKMRNPTSNSVWEYEYRGGTAMGLDLAGIANVESSDFALQAVYREFRRLQADGIVYASSTVDLDTQKETFSAGAVDAWGRTLYYRMEGNVGEVFSAGPDGKAGTADDITSRGTGKAWDDDED